MDKDCRGPIVRGGDLQSAEQVPWIADYKLLPFTMHCFNIFYNCLQQLLQLIASNFPTIGDTKVDIEDIDEELTFQLITPLITPIGYSNCHHHLAKVEAVFVAIATTNCKQILKQFVAAISTTNCTKCLSNL